jgi:hypothetical protein
MTPSAIDKRLKEIAARAGMDKRKAHTHAFRHYAATRMLRRGMTESMVKKSLGWTPSSTMLSRYSHIMSQDAENAYLRASGLRVPETPSVKDFTVPTSEVPPMAAPPETVVDLSDPRFQEYLDRWIIVRAKAMGLDTDRLMAPFSPEESLDPKERTAGARDRAADDEKDRRHGAI